MMGKTEQKVLPLRVQFKIFIDARNMFLKSYGGARGLCHFVRLGINNSKDIASNGMCDDIFALFPLFSNSNARQFKARVNGDIGFWWDIGTMYDYHNRLAFLNWIILELKKQMSV